MNRLSNPKNLTLSITAIFFALMVLSCLIASDEFKWIYIVVISLSVVVFYFATYYLLKNFIVEKIKVVYKNILSHKSKELWDQDIEKSWGENPIEEVGKKVENWSNSQNSEIEILKKQAKFRREFIGNLSHELKTPIFNIQGYVHTLLDGGLEDENINRNYLVRASKGVERMIELIEDLDEINKLDSGEIPLVQSDFEITKLVKEVFGALELTANQNHTVLKLRENNDAEIKVFGDVGKIRQVLMNLITNSIKYGIMGGWVEVGFTDMGDVIMVEVEDNGLGIEEKHLPRLFERFYRIDKSRNRAMGGSGLGLSIVKHIIEAHHQTIGVRSTPGEGSSFSFTLQKVK